ncbi:MAG: N-acetylneuraminate synthase family protein [Bacteroidales bacterium]|nr:N-acetylneuraminate synthase family protein [Bacteroidales bacterium]
MPHTYIIGEIGQNHNGSVAIAKLIIDLISKPVKEKLFGLNLKPMDAIKLTKRDLNEELSVSQMNKIYDNPNSFGKTYGEHRKFLELSEIEHFEIYKYAKTKNLEMVETICAIGALGVLKLFTPNYLKVASRDLTNIPLLQALAETKIPVIISTGMAGKKELDEALAVFAKVHSNLSILHCVSEYPTHPKNVNLNTITYLKENYSQYTIGYSDHTIGISAPVAAVSLGAKIIEKHVTIDRQMKGTDQAGSLGADGVNRMIRDIRITEMAMGDNDIFISESVRDTKNKLERSIASVRNIKAGEIISEADFHLLSPGDGLKWSERAFLIGKRAIRDIKKNEIIYYNNIEN